MIPFSDEELYKAVKNDIPTLSGYVGSHGGGIKLLGVKDAIVYIELTGACHGCAMSLMTTKMVVEQELRRLIHPELVVINVDGMPGNALPKDCYKEEGEAMEETKKEGFMDKVKSFFR